MTEWQPIETAPKDDDENYVLVYAVDTNRRWGVYKAYFSKIDKEWSCPPCPCFMGGSELLNNVISWMPLPEPPNE